MTSTSEDPHASAVISPGQQKGRARAALICAFFGTYWVIAAVAFSGHATPAWFTAAAVPGLALILWSARRVHAARPLRYTPADREHWRSVRTLFFLDVAIEYALVAAGGLILSHLHRMDLIPQVFGVVIGLHFIPLAIVFRAPRNYWTAVVITVASLASLLLPRGDLRNIAGCCAVGLPLWLTALSALTQPQAAPTIEPA